jgi:hypothetical protein
MGLFFLVYIYIKNIIMNKRMLKEMRFMMERLESPRMTETELKKRYKKLLKEEGVSGQETLGSLEERLKNDFPQLETYFDEGNLFIVLEQPYRNEKRGLEISGTDEFDGETYYIANGFSHVFNRGSLVDHDQYDNTEFTYEELVSQIESEMNY